MVWAIEWPEEQAKALIGLAPRQAELGQPEKSLGIVRQMKDGGWRGQALAKLAPHLPESLLPEASEMTSEIESEYWRSPAQVGLVMREAELGYFQNALTRINGIQDPDYKAQALAHLSPLLIEFGQVEEAISIAKEIGIEYWQTQAQMAIIPMLVVMGYPEEARIVVRTITRSDDRLEAIIQLVPVLAKQGYPQQALLTALELNNEQKKLQTLAELAIQLSKLSYFDEAMATALEIQDADKQILALAALIPHLPDSFRMVVLRQAISTAQTIESRGVRYQALTTLVPHLTVLPIEALTQIWLEEVKDADLLHNLAKRTRQDLLSDLLALEPVIALLGGAKAIGETFCAILEVGRWWS
jgi:hypothetical protein